MGLLRVAPLAMLLLISGCPASPSANAPQFPPSTAAAMPVPTRGCDSSVYGELGADWRERSTLIGPLAFIFSIGRRWEDFQSTTVRPDGFRFLKRLLTVENGRSATVSVPAEHRHNALLAYATDAGEHTVTFAACPVTAMRGPTQFNGGFLVREPACVPVEVTYDRTVTRIVLPVGVSGCPPGEPVAAKLVTCDEAIAYQPPRDETVILDAVALPTRMSLQANDNGQGRLFSKHGLYVRAGRVVDLKVSPQGPGRPAIGWGNTDSTGSELRIGPCQSAAGWLVFAGGYYVDNPTCLPVTVRTGERTEVARIGVGVTCG